MTLVSSGIVTCILLYYGILFFQIELEMAKKYHFFVTNSSKYQVTDQRHLQRPVRESFPHVPQPNLLFTASFPLCRHLHGVPQLSAELRPPAHLLPQTHTPAARVSYLARADQHRSHEHSLPEPQNNNRIRLERLNDRGFKMYVRTEQLLLCYITSIRFSFEKCG